MYVYQILWKLVLSQHCYCSGPLYIATHMQSFKCEPRLVNCPIHCPSRLHHLGTGQIFWQQPSLPFLSLIVQMHDPLSFIFNFSHLNLSSLIAKLTTEGLLHMTYLKLYIKCLWHVAMLDIWWRRYASASVEDQQKVRSFLFSWFQCNVSMKTA